MCSKALIGSRSGEDLPPKSGSPRIGLALGGGGARGLAHVLMIEALEELGVVPTAIAGTSIGAIYGAALASGLSAAHIRAHTEEILSQRFDLVRQLFLSRAEAVQRLFKLVPIRPALLNPEALLDYVLPSRVPSDFAALKIPLAVVATDFYAQEAVVLSRGGLRHAVAASMALPALFRPVVNEGRSLMDGGLVNPLPFDLLAGAVDIVIAIDVSGASRKPMGDNGPSAWEALLSSSQILQRSIVREKIKSAQPDIYIDVDVDQFTVLDFHRFRDILKASAPAKDKLKRQLERVLGSVTVPIAPPPETPALERPSGRLRLTTRLAAKVGKKARRKKN